MRTSNLSALFVVVLAACGGSSEPVAAPVDVPSAAAPTAAPDASASSSAAPAASSAQASAPPPASDKGPFHFTEYKGPKVKATISTPKAWNVQPVGKKSEWDILKIALEDFARVEGDEVVIKHFDGAEIFVPGALVFAAKPAQGLKKGDAVLADVAAASAPARVVGVEGEGDAVSINIKYRWGGSDSDAVLEPSQVVPLKGQLVYGARVAWKKDGAWKLGDYAGGDKSTAFVIGLGGHGELVDAKLLKALDLSKVFKTGAKVWADKWGTLAPATVTKVVSDGMAYKVKVDGEGESDEIDFDRVTAPLE